MVVLGWVGLVNIVIPFSLMLIDEIKTSIGGHNG
jgi:hypothetical protein